MSFEACDENLSTTPTFTDSLGTGFEVKGGAGRRRNRTECRGEKGRRVS